MSEGWVHESIIDDLETKLYAERKHAENRAAYADRLAAQLEQWEPVALALVKGVPVRNLDELIASTRSALRSFPGEGS